MRSACCTLAILLFVGCRSQSAPISNPFLSPDRVPPPATRALLPGTAQPYYPGDPAPNLPAGGAVTPNAGQGTTYAPSPITPTGPPGGWNANPQSYPAQQAPNTSSPYNVNPTNFETPLPTGTPANEPAVRVQTDNESLRFVETPQQQYAPDSFSVAPVPTTSQVVPSQYQSELPSQGLASQEGFSPLVTPTSGVKPSQFVQQPVPETMRAVRIRPVNSEISRDGFRPQGSRRKEQAAAGESSASREIGPVHEAADRFGFDPQYQWLRGQLQYVAATNEWQLRYVPVQSQPDQFGGRVLIGNSHVLGDLQPGSYVQVQGRFHEPASSA